MYYLTAVEGPCKGSTWTIGPEGLLLGRSLACEISIDDPSVSRRHCRIFPETEGLRLEELGSRNPTLVNGEPANGKILKAGDHVALGDSVFIITGDLGSRTAGQPPIPGEETSPALSDGRPVYLDGDPKALWLQERPRTVHDLINLYDTTRELCAANSWHDFMVRLEARLSERFNPLELWVARVREGEGSGISLLSGQAGADAAALETMRTALREGRGLLLPSIHRQDGRRVRKVTLAAPMLYGGIPTAVLAVRTLPAAGVSPTADLAFLVLLANSLAPLIHALDRTEQLRQENERLSAKAGESRSIVGESHGIVMVRKAVATAARSTLNVLITGETGTGKELTARLLHAQSSRHNRPLVVVNCAAIPRELFESELFGHTEGSFTGAHRSSPGLLDKADGGTLFLDEIGDLSLENQARILRVVEDGTYRPVGARDERRVDLRIVAATNKDLPEALRRGAFREDLYHRLNGFQIHVPALRDRSSDIPLLAEHFFRLAAGEAKHPLRGIAPEIIECLTKRPWPGNVRELRNSIFRAISNAVGDIVCAEDFIEISPVTPSSGYTATGPILSLAEIEKLHIETILKRCDGNVSEAARVLGIGRSTLYRMLAEYRIVP